MFALIVAKKSQKPTMVEMGFAIYVHLIINEELPKYYALPIKVKDPAPP